MASSISDLLAQILTAIYGKDVRQSIHDSISQCYTDVSTAKTLADDSIATAEEAATNAESRVTTAINGMESRTNSAIANCNAATTNANTAAANATSKASAAKKSYDDLIASIGTIINDVERVERAAESIIEHEASIEVFESTGITVVNGRLCVPVERN